MFRVRAGLNKVLQVNFDIKAFLLKPEPQVKTSDWLKVPNFSPVRTPDGSLTWWMLKVKSLTV